MKARKRKRHTVAVRLSDEDMRHVRKVARRTNWSIATTLRVMIDVHRRTTMPGYAEAPF